MGRVAKREITVNKVQYIWTIKGDEIYSNDHHIGLHIYHFTLDQ